jgi:tRNA U34 5-methylaminomethyl-2-thiouridine-forming methyltransferase MnmC
MARVIKSSSDGSHTVFDEVLQETYHSVYGSITESEHVFINACYLMLKDSSAKVLEVGFGTGLNAWLTLIFAEKMKRHTEYTTYELYPLDEVLISNLNFAKIKYNEYSNNFSSIHKVDWGIENELSKYFMLKKIIADFTSVSISEKFNLVFFDAFSPEKQPEMWTSEIFKKIYISMLPNGILTTYCAKGSVKRILKEIGFHIELIPGPPGKRHMIRATK